MLLGQLVTLCAWAALILTVSGLAVALRRPPRTPVGQVVGATAGLLLAAGLLVRAETPLYLPLTAAGCALAALSLALVIRVRAS